MQQLSTPLPLAFVTAHAGRSPLPICPRNFGRPGLLAVNAEIARPSLILNELAPKRRSARLVVSARSRFPTRCGPYRRPPKCPDQTLRRVQPSASPMRTWRHVASAYPAPAFGGHLAAISGTGLSPENPKWRPSFERLQQGRAVTATAVSMPLPLCKTAETRVTIIGISRRSGTR